MNTVKKQSRDKDLANAEAALRRAADRAKKIAEQIIPTQSSLDETIKQALELGKPFEHKGTVYVPTQGVILKK